MMGQVLAWLAIAGVAIAAPWVQRRFARSWESDEAFARLMRRRYGRAA